MTQRLPPHLSAEESFDILAKALKAATFFCDRNDRIQFVNPSANTVFGFDDNKHLGTAVSDWIQYETSEFITSDAQSPPVFQEVQGRNADQTPLFLEVAKVTFKTPSHQGSLFLARDVSNRREAEQKLLQEKLKAEIANRAKSDFLTSMSHELRTPLNGILGYAQLIQPDAIDARILKEASSAILQSGEHLLELINDILDLAKIENQEYQLKFENTLLHATIESCINTLKRSAEQKGLQLTFEDLTPSQTHLWVDPRRFKQVVFNLLSNAIKYNETPNGYVKIICRKIEEKVKIEVIDNGKGIPRSLQNHLFTPFNRLGSELSEVEGTGIGLTITKQLVEKMQGEIGFQSQMNFGSTFWVELPLAENAHTSVTAAIDDHKVNDETTEKNNPAETLSILVAEDHQINRQIIQLQLQQIGYEATIVEDGQKAFDLLQKQRFDLLLTDIHMPLMDGYELAKSIQHLPVQQRPIIIAISANVIGEAEERARSFGISDFLGKPFRLEELQEKINYWGAQLAKPEPNTELEQEKHSETALSPSNDSLPTEVYFQPDLLSQTLGDDLELQKELVNQFLSLAKPQMETISQLLEQLLNENDDSKMLWETLQSHAHQLKSSSRAIQASLLGSILEKIEKNAKVQTRFNPTAVKELTDCWQHTQLQIEHFLSSETTKTQAFSQNGIGRIDLEKAIENKEFYLLFQPKISLTAFKPIGVEVFLRWHHPQLGNIPPQEFLSLSEEFGLLTPINQYIFQQTFPPLYALLQEYDCRLSLNVDLDVLSDEAFIAFLHQQFITGPFDKDFLIIEVQEEEIQSSRQPEALEVLQRLRAEGFQISIDDFGSAPLSIQQLKTIQPFEIKLDHHVVHNASFDAHTRRVLQSSVNLAHQLGVDIVAEGVEQKEDLSLLKKMGCDAAQGYYIARPMTHEKLHLWLEQWRQKQTQRT